MLLKFLFYLYRNKGKILIYPKIQFLVKSANKYQKIISDFMLMCEAFRTFSPCFPA